MTLANKVRGLRQELGWNQVTLAQKSGITQATISRIESGKVTQPKMGQYIKLADSLKTTVEYFIQEEKMINKPDVLTDEEVNEILEKPYPLPRSSDNSGMPPSIGEIKKTMVCDVIFSFTSMPQRFADRLRWCWKMLRTGVGFEHDFILRETDCKELIGILKQSTVYGLENDESYQEE